MANIFAILTAVVAVLAFGYFWVGYIKHPIPIWMRIILLAAGVLALMPSTSVCGDCAGYRGSVLYSVCNRKGESP